MCLSFYFCLCSWYHYRYHKCCSRNKLHNIDNLISKALINSCISRDEFVSVNDVFKEYNGMKAAIKYITIVNSDNA